jgi:hypothetical protein
MISSHRVLHELLLQSRFGRLVYEGDQGQSYRKGVYTGVISSAAELLA